MRFIVVAVALLAGTVAVPAQSATPASQVPTVLDVSVVRQNGSTVPLRAVVGDAPAIVAFWASYCVPCRSEVPSLNQANIRWRGRGLRVIGVALETDVKRVRAARTSWGMRYDVLRIAPGQDDLLDRLFPRGLPVTAFVAHGEATMHDQVIDDAELDRRAPVLLGDAPAP